jgi:hypothetical protein
VAEPEPIEGLLLEAQSLELIDRFPTAFGGGVADNQCRLNEWGWRLLGAAADRAGAVERAGWRTRLRAHLVANQPAYRELVERSLAPDHDRCGPADQLPILLLR